MFGLNKDKPMSDEAVLDRQDQSSKDVTLLSNVAGTQSEMMQNEQQKQKEDLVRWQQSLGDEMIQLEYDLKRKHYNSETKKWESIKIWAYNEKQELVEVDAPPLCNDFCIQMIKTVARPFMSKNEMMTNYSEERILCKLRSTMKTLIRNIGIKYDYYEVDFHDISAIRQTIQNFIMSSPYRALNNGERKYIQSSTRRIETINEGMPLQRKKILGFI